MNLLLAGSFDDDAERDAWAAALGQALPGHRVVVDGISRHAVPADSIEVAIVANPPPGSLQGLPRLRLIQSLWAGVDRLLADPTLPAEVPIARMVDPAMNAAMAQTALWAVLSLHRGFYAYARAQAEGRWAPHPQRRADEVPVLLLGCGQMGLACARALAAQGYPVSAWRRGSGAKPEGLPPGVALLQGDTALRDALPGAQVLLNLLPLTPDTRGLLAAPLLAALPRFAGVVNLARGAHVVDADLLAALDSGHIGHAVLDVFTTEPLPAGHPYWHHPRVTLLPHAAAATDLRSAAAIAAANVQALADGRPLAHRVERGRGY